MFRLCYHKKDSAIFYITFLEHVFLNGGARYWFTAAKIIHILDHSGMPVYSRISYGEILDDRKHCPVSSAE